HCLVAGEDEANMNLRELVDALGRKEAFASLGRGATNAEVAHVQSSLEILLPPCYAEFLRICGYASWFGHAVLGVSNDATYDTVGYTQRIRDRKLPKGVARLPKNGNVVMKYGGGGQYFLYAADTLRAGEVVLFTDEMGGAEDDAESWKSFEEFLECFVNL